MAAIKMAPRKRAEMLTPEDVAGKPDEKTQADFEQAAADFAKRLGWDDSKRKPGDDEFEGKDESHPEAHKRHPMTCGQVRVVLTRLAHQYYQSTLRKSVTAPTADDIMGHLSLGPGSRAEVEQWLSSLSG